MPDLPADATPPPPGENSANKDVLLAMLAQLSEDMRFQSQAEHLYTAAAVGSFWAVSWGVSALKPHDYAGKCFTHPAIVAVAGIFFVLAAVIVKIVLSHCTWLKLRRARVDTAKKFASDDQNLIPREYIHPESRGWGFIGSTALVFVAAIGSMAFCVAMFATSN